MVEKQSINGKEVWLKVDPYHVERANRNIIPTEYFTATCYMQEPASGSPVGELVTDRRRRTKAVRIACGRTGFCAEEP
jgi:hypothetical protein